MASPNGPELAKLLATYGDTPGKVRCEAPLTPSDGPVCVTGASGFIALHLVQQLLQKGYRVRGTVRSIDNKIKMAPLLAFQQQFGADKLEIVGGVDCGKAESFEPAVRGCVGVFHTASPFTFASQDPFKDLVEPAVQGTNGCLEACKKVGSVKRVVVTSSLAAIFSPGILPPDYHYTSKDWNQVSYPNADGTFPEPAGPSAYRYSKIAAEKCAWDFAASEDCPFDVACINPTMVIGHNFNKPTEVSDLNQSTSILLKILTGQQAPNPNSVGWVDAADVARAHITAYESLAAGGRRFLCTSDEVPLWTEMAQKLKDLYPSYPVITAPPEGGAGSRMRLDCSALKELGFEFTPLKDTIESQCSSLLGSGFAKL